MKSQLILVALIATLASPTWAQLGPAGVPGAPGLVETDPSVKNSPVTPPAPAVVLQPASEPEKKVVAECKPTTNKHCKPKPCSAKAKGRDCKTKPKATPAKRPSIVSCDKASDPAVCREHERVRKTCAVKQGEDYRQCLRDQLTP